MPPTTPTTDVHFKISWRLVRSLFYALLGTLLFAMVVLGWQLPPVIAGFTGLITLAIVFALLFAYFNERRR